MANSRPYARYTWTLEEEFQLLKMFSQGTKQVVMGLRLKKTVNAIKHKLMRMGLTRPKRHKHGQLRSKVVRLHAKGMSDSEIADELELKAVSGVGAIRRDLNLPRNLTASQAGRIAGHVSGVMRRDKSSEQKVQTVDLS